MSGATHSRRTIQSLGMAALLLPILAWGVGLAWYVRLIDATPAPVPLADGIVALTGGAERVETALQLLARGQAPRLLLSGIGGGAGLPDLDNHAGVDAPKLAAQITLGRGAQSTRGNAIETANWVRREGIRSLIVVTAAYHMPRALLELQRALPDVSLFPVPVHPQGFTGWRRLRLVAAEFSKFLAARAGLSAFAPERRNTRPGSFSRTHPVSPGAVSPAVSPGPVSPGPAFPG
jgi:uncharacterized SAM-binding protein YcdF (DUF218 family)